MRKFIISFGLFLLTSVSLFAQKKGLNYQAVIIDPNPIEVPGIAVTGQPLMNGKVTIRFTIRSSAAVDYAETQNLTTDEFGLVNTTIGNGIVQGNVGSSSANGIRYASFDAIEWNAELKSLIVAVSFDNGQKFTEVSNQKLNFTPYALYAESVDYKNVRDSPTSLSQFKNDAGYLIPQDLDPLKQDIAKNSATIDANQKTTDEKFRAAEQSITVLDEKIATNSKDITRINGTLIDYDARLISNAAKIFSTESSLSSRIGLVQSLTETNQNAINNLSGSYESISNKSTNTDLGAANPSDQLYPTQKATKTYVDNTVYAAVGSGVPDATTLAAGKVKLSGDLGGTAMSPSVPALTTKENLTNKSINVQTDGNSNTMYPSVKAVKDYVDQATMGTALQASLDAKADKSSPTLTGFPLAPTAAANTNNTQIATTAFVQQALSAGVADATSSSKGKIALRQDLGGTADSPTVPGLLLKENLSNKSDNTSLGTSTTAYPTQNAVKVYVDNQVASASIADATDLVKGKIRLGGDLNGTGSSASTPIISNNAITTAKIGNLQVTDAKIATVSASKITGAVDIANGGTAATTAGAALTNLGAQSSANLSTDMTGTDATSLTKYPAVKSIKDYVDTQVAAATIADATTSLKGKIQLAGDLAGTAASPTVPGLALKAPIESPTFSGTVSGITKAMVGLANADNTSDVNKPVSTAAQIAMSLKAPLESPTFTGAPVLPTATTGVTQVSGDNSTKLATTAFVMSNVTAGTPDATTSATGKIQLAGDLSGSAASPTIATGAVTSTKILDGTIINADIDANAAILDTKLATIATAGKVSNSATTATHLNTASAIVARDANGDFTAGTITANLTGIASKATNINGGNLGDLAYQSAPNTTSLLAGNTSTTKKFLTQTGTASAAVAPLWGTVGTTDITDLGGNVAAFLADPTSVKLANAMTNETGTGSVVFSTSPMLVNPTLGAASATSVAFGGSTSGTATIAAPVVAGTTTITLPATTGTLATLDGTETLTNKTFTSPTFTAPALGTPASGVLKNATGLPLTTGVTGILAITNGGTGATTATGALTALGAQASANLSTDIAVDAASLEKYPAVKTVKDYVDATVTSGAPDATTNVKGKVQLAGDLAGTGSTSAAPIISNNAITTVKINADAVTTAKILDGTIVNADISTTAAIEDTKLATIASVGKIRNSATTADDANTASAIVARDAGGNFVAGTVTANLTGTASKATNIAGGAIGAIPYQTAANTTGLLTGNTSATKRFLTQSGNGTLADAPVWTGVAVSDITGTLPVANGGTGVTTTAANLVFAGPTSGSSAAAPSFRALVAADLPTGSANYVNNGTTQQASTDFNISGSGTIGTTLDVTGNTTISGGITVGGSTTLSQLSATKGVFTDASKRLTSTGTLGADQGGTGMTSFNSGGAMYATSTSTLTTGTLPTSAGGTGLNTFTSGGALYLTSTTAITSGTLPLTAGGTGATTKATAFNALSPMSASGDLIYGGSSGAATVLAKGSDGQVLYLASGAPSWASIPTATSTVAGYLASADWSTFSGKQVAYTNLTTIGSLSNGTGFLKNTGSGTFTYANPAVSEITGLGTGVATWLATPSSTNFAGAITDETGTGSIVLATSPTLITPSIGIASGTSLNVSGQLTSTVATGTAPLVVTSTTPVSNLSIGGNAATATTATNIAGGLSGSIPYQTAAGTTSLLAKGTNGQILTLESGLPAWTASSAVTSIGAILGSSTANGASITLNVLNLSPADGTNGGVVTTAVQTFAGAKTFSANTAVSGTSTLTVGTGATSLGGTLGVSGATNISSATPSSSTSTGALVVTGGVGIGGATYIGGQLSIAGGTPGLGKVLTSDANGLATWSNNSSISSGGGVLSKSDSYDIATTDNANYLIFSGSATSKTIKLPSASTVGAGREITIKNIASVTVTVGSAGGYVISDSLTTTASSLVIGIEPSNNWIKAISDGTNWIILRALF
jgi:hypothetical protein